MENNQIRIRVERSVLLQAPSQSISFSEDAVGLEAHHLHADSKTASHPHQFRLLSAKNQTLTSDHNLQIVDLIYHLFWSPQIGLLSSPWRSCLNSFLLHEYGPFKEPVIQNYTRQILSGLAYLHARKNSV